MSQEPMPTRTRLATFVIAVAATAIGFLTPADAVNDSAGSPDHSAADRTAVSPRSV